MDTVPNNVTQIDRFSRERRSAANARSPLDGCREIAALGLVKALGESLEQIKLQLLQQMEKSLSPEVYSLYMDTLALVRDRRAGIETGFRTAFLQRFNQACRRSPGRKNGIAPLGELSLLEPDDLEQSLAADSLTNTLHNTCVAELFGLDKRIGMLINDPDLANGDNPLGPEVISAALMDALEGEGAQMKVRLLVVTQMSRQLPARTKDVYHEANQYLVKRNVLPTIRVGMRNPAPAAPAAPSARQAQPAGGGGDVLAMLQQLLGGNAAGTPVMPIAGPALPGESADIQGSAQGGMVVPLRPGTFVYALNQLQHGEGEAVSRAGLEAEVLHGGQVNVLHGLRDSGLAGGIGSFEAMTLDIVAMVFDYIFDDRRIPDAIKAQIGRLQIPVLKVAMLDKSFFTQKNHPARRLLDVLAEAAIGWDATEGHEGGLYRKIEQLVDEILNRFDNRIELFSEVLTDLEGFLAEERKAVARAAAGSVQTLRNRELAELSRQAASDEVQSALLGRQVPAVIAAFLTDHWQRMLADIHQKVGEANPAWTGAMATVTDLVWSVESKADPAERKRLVAMLPGLLKRLDEGMGYIGLEKAERDRFFSGLVRCHAVAVRAGLSDETEATPSAVETEIESMAIPDSFDPAGFEPVEAVAETAETPAEVLEELAVQEVAAAVPVAEGLESLRRGSWIEYIQEDGGLVLAKLSWISPLGGLYLFTNRYGRRAISINAEGLAAKLRSGEVRLLDAKPLMDRAVDNLMERLERHAA